MKTMKTIIILEESKLSAAIGSIARRGANLDRDIWITGASILAHAKRHGDFSNFARLLNALPQGSRVNALVGWAQEFVPLAASRDSKTKIWKCSINKKSEDFVSPDRSDWLSELSLESPWWDWKKAPVTVEFDLTALIALLDKVEKRQNATPGAVEGAMVALAAIKLLQGAVKPAAVVTANLAVAA
jgi:hypothetical protein